MFCGGGVLVKVWGCLGVLLIRDIFDVVDVGDL